MNVKCETAKVMMMTDDGFLLLLSYLKILSRSVFLGWAFSVGMILVKNNGWWDSPFGLYICVLSFFHYSEYLVTSVISPSTLSLDSFLLNHSREYGVAALASWVEYGLESYLFPGMSLSLNAIINDVNSYILLLCCSLLFHLI